MLELLHFSVGKDNKAILTILTDAGREILEISEADIKAIVNMQYTSPPPLPPARCDRCGFVSEYGYCLNSQCLADADKLFYRDGEWYVDNR